MKMTMTTTMVMMMMIMIMMMMMMIILPSRTAVQQGHDYDIQKMVLANEEDGGAEDDAGD